MQLDLSVLNQKGAPALYEDTLANRPTAGFVGRLFVSTDTDELYRDNGATWDLIGGGGGGAVGDGISILGAGTIANPFNSGLDAILAVGQPLSVDSSFKFNNFNVDFTGTKRVRFQTTSPVKTLFLIDKTTGNINLGFDDCNLDFDQTNKILNTYINGVNIGLNLDFTNEVYIFGDQNSLNFSYLVCNAFGLTSLNCYNDNTGITYYVQTDANADYFIVSRNGSYYIDINLTQKRSYFGDPGVFDGSISRLECFADTTVGKLNLHTYLDTTGIDYLLNIDSDTDAVKLTRNTVDIGFKIDVANQQYYFGDFNSVFGTNRYIEIDAANKEFIVATDKINFSSLNIIQGSSGATSGQHLKVTVNGTNYVIELKNP